MWRLWAFVLLAMTGCGEQASEPPSSPPGCPQLWEGHFQGASAGFAVEVRDGALELQLSNAINGEALFVSQDRYVSGDFVVRAEFADLVHNTTGGTVEVEAAPESDPGGPFSARAAIDRDTVDAAVAGTDGVTDTDYQLEAAAASGSFQVERAGTNLVATVTAGSSQARASGTFEEDRIVMRILLTNRSMGADDVAVRIISFDVTAQLGTLRSDDFACDTFVGMAP